MNVIGVPGSVFVRSADAVTEGRAYTATSTEAVAFPPDASATEQVAVIVPAASYRCVAVSPEGVSPSPKSHANSYGPKGALQSVFEQEKETSIPTSVSIGFADAVASISG